MGPFKVGKEFLISGVDRFIMENGSLDSKDSKDFKFLEDQQIFLKAMKQVTKKRFDHIYKLTAKHCRQMIICANTLLRLNATPFMDASHLDHFTLEKNFQKMAEWLEENLPLCYSKRVTVWDFFQSDWEITLLPEYKKTSVHTLDNGFRKPNGYTLSLHQKEYSLEKVARLTEIKKINSGTNVKGLERKMVMEKWIDLWSEKQNLVSKELTELASLSEKFNKEFDKYHTEYTYILKMYRKNIQDIFILSDFKGIKKRFKELKTQFALAPWFNNILLDQFFASTDTAEKAETAVAKSPKLPKLP